ncbi:MAG: 50S ribosomal protein P1 [Thermoplasmata archaeon]|jgi:large subunit ribosomal protein L12
MEYIYGAMLLHVAGQEVNEANLKSVLKAAGLKPNDARIKALAASLEDVDIEEAMKGAVAAPVAPAPAPEEQKPKEQKPDEKKEKKKKEEEEVSEEEAAAGLGALFGM